MGVSIQHVCTDQQRKLLDTSTWAGRTAILWSCRKTLLRVFVATVPVSIALVMLIPKQYKSVARIMPPDQQSAGASMFAALAARPGSFGALGSLAGLLGTHPTTALFISLLQSGTIRADLVNRFQLQQIYHKRYAVDAEAKLAHRTTITDDKKSGVITLEVTDSSPARARDLAQAYLDGLNQVVIQTTNSSAHQERMFIEQRLKTVTADLEGAQRDLSEYSSRTNTVDLKEQTRAMVDAGARIEASVTIEQSALNSLRQVYGDQNIRVREAEARIATLRRELTRVAGMPIATDSDSRSGANELYPPLRQLPELAVPYADLFRRVRVQEAVYELLTQQYEAARIQEAKDVPVVAVIDRPGVPEKKSFPPRTLLVIALDASAVVCASVWILLRERWGELPPDHHLRIFVEQSSFRTRNPSERVAS